MHQAWDVGHEADDGAVDVAWVLLAWGGLLHHARAGVGDPPYRAARARLGVAEAEVGFQGLAFGSCCPGLDDAEDVAVRSAGPVPCYAETDAVVVAAVAVVDGEVFAAAAYSGEG